LPARAGSKSADFQVEGDQGFKEEGADGSEAEFEMSDPVAG
jgi:hypothetical protein